MVRYNYYDNFQLLSVLIHQWKDLSRDFVTGLPVSSNCKRDTYDSILVIFDHLTRMVYYKSVKATIHAQSLAKVTLDVVVCYHGLLDSILIDKGSLLTLKFWSLLYYFLGIKKRLSTAFHPHINSQIKRRNSTLKVYLQAFVNFKQNNWTRLLFIAKFVYNNAKNTSTGHTLFELNCGYHPRVSYKENIDPWLKPKLANDLLSELQEPMIICCENF